MAVQATWQSRYQPYEKRIIGTVTNPGPNTLVKAINESFQILEIAMQSDIDTVVQVLDNGKPVGGLWTLKASLFYSEPAFIPTSPTSTISLSISNAAVVSFVVRYVTISAVDGKLI